MKRSHLSFVNYYHDSTPPYAREQHRMCKEASLDIAQDVDADMQDIMEEDACWMCGCTGDVV